MSVKAVLYNRVSDERQLEGYSPEVQDRGGENYAVRNDLEIVRRWTVQESAKAAGRKAFNEMIKFVKADPSIKVIIFEKTDRSTRNFYDVDQLYKLIEVHDKELHFYKTGLILNKRSKSSDKLRFDIEAVLARNYVNNLSEEVKKGLDEKVRRGGWGACSPSGYLNDPATRDCVQDPNQGPIVRRMFELGATGRQNLEELLVIARKAGLMNPHKKKLVGKSGLYHILTNPFYFGLVIWKGETFQGKHEPLISKALFDRVQQVLGRKKRPKHRKFAFQGLGVCGHCGSSITADFHTKRQKNGKKHEYVHYHCTGWKNGGKVCPGSRISERDLVAQLGEPLKGLWIDAQTVEEIKAALRESFASERDYQKERLTSLHAEGTRLKSWIDKAYKDRLDELITPEEFKEKSCEWRARQLEIQNEVRAHTVADGKYLEEAGRILDLAQRAHAIYLEEPDNFNRRRLVDAVVSKVTLQDNRALSNLWEPFNTLSKVAVAAKSPDRSSLWWPFGHSLRNNSAPAAAPSGP
jgi:DNA invertase Pin-like site-specific DNA recombinase